MEEQSDHVSPSRSPAFQVVYGVVNGGMGKGGFSARVTAFLNYGYKLHGNTEYTVEDGKVIAFQSLINYDKLKTDKTE